ncbi:uncharacterized protein LOC144912447 [Branchiostoma floridae x Branchiostoma belcheri]
MLKRSLGVSFFRGATLVVFMCHLRLTIAADSPYAPNSTTSSMYATMPPTTPDGEEDECSSRKSSCDECIKNVKCYFCLKDKSCRLYPVCAVLPTAECPLAQVRWGPSCDVSFEVLVIAVAVVSGVLVLALCCCCCYCCCRKSRGGRHTWRAFKWSRDNRSNQMNPNNWRYWSSRGYGYDFDLYDF